MALFPSGSEYAQSGYVLTDYVYNPPPYTTIGPMGVPIAYDYEASKATFGTKTYLGTVTRLSPVGISQSTFGSAGAVITERRDTVYAYESTTDTGDADITESRDPVSANGSVAGADFSNLWFNASWFNAAWFNSDWFNTTESYTGSADITEDGDTTAATSHVFILATADITEDHDTTTTYGSGGNDVAGDANIAEARDFRKIEGRVLVSAEATITEARDVVTAAGPLSIADLKLTWEQVGGMTKVDIYRSTDGVNFTKIDTVNNSSGTYTDYDVNAAFDYYYYLIGTTTIDTETDPSDTVFVDLSN